MMYAKIIENLGHFSDSHISIHRKAVLQPFINYLLSSLSKSEPIRLNFICTHNSRRSHLAQIWAQTLAYYFGINNLQCYSGGTEATALYFKVAETLTNQGFKIQKLSEGNNPVFAVKFAANEMPIICFSKNFLNEFNPQNNFVAILTCDNADDQCPIVAGADVRFPIKYNDPKIFDNTSLQDEKYAERSLEIAEEMWWIFKTINQNV